MQMQLNDRYYDIFPKVLRVGKKSTVTIVQSFDNVAFKPELTYSFRLNEMDTGIRTPVEPVFDGNRIQLTFTPEKEQEYRLVLNATNADGITTELTSFNFYALNEDLASLKPWKGDFHVHSCRSDGKDSPLYTAANYRRHGFDFFALTDHRRYTPSLEVVEAFKKLDTDFRVFPGEEVHPPKTITHHINFGGSFSVHELSLQEGFDAEVAEIEKTITHPWLSATEKTSYAVSLWTFRKIRDAGGISIFCHPYWVWRNLFNVSENIIKAAFIDRTFDAFELIGGYAKHETASNALQIARWQEEQAKGNTIPAVAVSDSHGTETGSLFGWYYTIVFAPSTQFADIADAIRNNRCVAVSAISGEATLQQYGQFRLVKYAFFLQREIFPLHDEECEEEGRQMLRHFKGNADAAAKVAACKDAVTKLYDKLFD